MMNGLDSNPGSLAFENVRSTKGPKMMPMLFVYILLAICLLNNAWKILLTLINKLFYHCYSVNYMKLRTFSLALEVKL